MSKQEGFCMVGGTGFTSYANNSLIQKSIIGKTRSLLEESIRAAVCESSAEYLAIADLGCSSGPNALAVLQSIINVVVSTTRRSGSTIPKLNVFLNDLPQNDFNSIFNMLPSFRKEIEQENGVGIECCISGTPGSFYDRIFPRNTMHFMCSFTSLHWLSQVPKVKDTGCIYGRKGSPREVLEAYRDQFSDDFGMFLRCRSEEIVHGGRILLSFLVTKDDELCPLMEFTSIALYKLASQGRIDKEKLEKFNIQYYRPTIDQVKQIVESEGNFFLDKMHTFPVSWIEISKAAQVKKKGTYKDDVYQSNIDIANSITISVRAIIESILTREFGEEMVDEVFHLVQEMVINSMTTGQDIQHMNLVVSLTRK